MTRLVSLDASFVALQPDGSIEHLPSLEGAHAVMFDCPCGKHSNLIAFEPTVGTAPTDRGGLARGGGRWQREGNTLDTLTLKPSIDVQTRPDGGSCWHGFITNGEVTTV